MIYQLFNSTNHNKKYMVVFVNEVTGRLNKIHFGSFGYHDYTILSSIEKHQNVDANLKLSKDNFLPQKRNNIISSSDSKKRKELYKLRHANDNVDDLSYPGAWSMNLLWNKKTLEKSIIDMEERYNITIVNNLD